MDEIAELNRIWESMESRLSALNGEQEREYNVVHEGKIIGTVNIPVEADDDDIIEIFREWTEGNAIFSSTNEYETSEDGRDNEININVTIYGDDESSYLLSLVTNDEIEDFDEFMQNVLDIHREQYLSGRDGWITKEYTIVTGTGGPHVEFTTGYEIRVYWAGKSREFTTYDDGARATMDRIEEYLDELYTEN